MDIHEYIRTRGISEEELEAARQRAQAYEDAYNLAQIRKERELTQMEVAQRMGVSQKRVSELERGNPGVVQRDTLRRYIESLGGELISVARFPDREIVLSSQ